MFAVIDAGGRQYRVKPGDKLRIDFRNEVKRGDTLTFDRVLAAGTEAEARIGRPLVEGAVVEAQVVDPEVRGPKLEIGKFKRRKNYIRHNGHIQRYTSVKVTGISVPGLVDDTPAEQPVGVPEKADQPEVTAPEPVAGTET